MPRSSGPEERRTEWRRWRERVLAALPRPAVWIGLTLALAALDYFAGPHVSIAPLYLLPLGLAAWFGPLRWALAIGLVLPAVRLSYFILDGWEPPGRVADVVTNAVVRVVVLALVAVLIGRARRASDLQREVIALRGLLPICMYCKQIQDADDRWYPVEQYVGARSGAAFTHRVCPNCTETHRRVFLGSGGVGMPRKPSE